MSVMVVVMTDGRRQYMEPAMESLCRHLLGPINCYVIHDDSGDPEYRAWLRHEFPWCTVIGDKTGRSGFCAAYAAAWSWISTRPDPWVFQTEDDFTFNEDVDLTDLLGVMEDHPHIAQMQLRRQPWGAEPAEGGFIGQWPHFYRDVTDGKHHWLEHRRNWSTNPGLFRREICATGWPLRPGCEGHLGDRLCAQDPNLAFAVWGQRDDRPLVHHIGNERVGHSY